MCVWGVGGGRGASGFNVSVLGAILEGVVIKRGEGI